MNLIKSKQKLTAVLLAGAVVLMIGVSTYCAGSGGLLAAYAAAQTITTVREVPVDQTLFVECAAGGAGEEVHFTGKAHNVDHTTFDGAGGGHLKVEANFQGVTGTGLTTGDKYQAPLVFHLESNAKVGAEQTFVFIVNYIGQGGNANNFLGHVTFHITIHPDGTVTASFTNISVECR